MNSHRDHFARGFDASTLESRYFDLVSQEDPDEELRSRYNLLDNSDFKLTHARDRLRKIKNSKDIILPCLYRPFDFRFILYDSSILDRPRIELNSHFIGKPNLGLITTRQTREPFSALAANGICGQHKIVAKYDGSSVFPLYAYVSEKFLSVL
jgi:predicted helicase